MVRKKNHKLFSKRNSQNKTDMPCFKTKFSKNFWFKLNQAYN